MSSEYDIPGSTIYKWISELKPLSVTDEGSLILLKPFIESVNATFIKFETEDEKNEALMHLNHYFTLMVTQKH